MYALPDLRPDQILIYLRKSRTDDPALTVSETVAKHETMLDDWCRRNLGELVPECNRFREVVSGETIAARPEVQKVLRLIEQPQFRAVLVVEPQRLSRGDLEDIGRLTKLLRYTSTIVITLQFIYDLTDERDREYFERELMRGNDYLQYSKRIMQNGLRLSAENGNYLGSTPPYGYRIAKIKEGKRKASTLAIVPEEAEAVRMMFRMYAAGSGAATICKVLNDSGIRPRSADFWRPPVIYRILDNPHYIGLIRYDFRRMQKTVVDGEIKVIRRKRTDAGLYPGKHPAIITQELWDSVQAARKARHLPPIRSHLDIQNPLAGIMYCQCGSVMIKAAQLKGRNIRIHCKDQARCGNAGCTVDVLMQMISDAIREEIADRTITEGIIGADDAELAAGKVKALTGRLAALEAKRESLWDKYAEDGMPKDIFDRLLARTESDISAVTDQLAAAKREAEITATSVTAQTSLHAALDALSVDAPPKEANAMLRAVIERITYSRARQYRDDRGIVIRPDPDLHIVFKV